MTEFILYVENQQRSRDFYKAILGKEPVLDVLGMTEFMLSEECKLGLMPSAGIARILGSATPNPSTGNGIPRCELYLFWGDTKACFERAINAGALPVSPPAARDWDHTVAYVADPDGHIVAFAE